MVVYIESILPNQIKMILGSFFSEDNVLSDEIKICYIFDENRAFRLFWDTKTYVKPVK